MKLNKKTIKEKSIILRINLIALFIGILMIFKWTLGFFPGFEILTFFIVFFSLFMYLTDIFLITITFSLFVCVIYGFNTWVIPYFVVLPLQGTLTFILKKYISRNLITLGLWTFFLALLWTPAYFFSDLAIFGKTSAIAGIITSVPTSLIGGLLNFGVTILIAPFLVNLFLHRLRKPYNLVHLNNLQTLKYQKLWMSSLSLFSVGGIVGVEISAIKFIEMGDIYNRENSYEYGKGILVEDRYNQIKSNLGENECELIVSAGELTYSSTIKNCGGQKLGDILFRKEGFTDNNSLRTINPGLMSVEHKFWIKEVENMSGGIYGSFIGNLEVTYEKDVKPLVIEGRCPFIHIHRFSKSGVSFIELKPNDVIQIAYNATGLDGGVCSY